ncbi:MAG: translational GTPase TypA [Eggerthellaceae bacterium]|uniref:Large ribosomal subunit assembly factor BipA n=1 Tax=Denitrobacterium detoxificans TaxID=79604 RepID=A0A172RVU0_9ACTN|nr:translational GTPase TypA [Denitrobacterium detoxificans]ANE21836.1 GTP-binding protein TypA [Denitrobacterium detoxificans]MCR5583041.1 translational GTPase TypA [Eggerthellaceae bacterium]SEO42410.1 GTP-binding protein [Denitrobacterium detoxificans]
MKQEHIRNVAIIAHVDHGKTTLVDQLMKATNVFRENQQVEDRVLDSNDQERERGITILSKNISITYNDTKINVIDTPGHADFGGEVERVLNMADGALLIVDAFEGPMPQTRFVLRHALDLGLRIVVVVNKIDRPGARPEEVVDEVFDLMVELEASDEQLDFPVVYASAMNGYARYEATDDNDNMIPLLDTILKEIPAPDCEPEGPVALQVCTVDHSSFVGRIGVGRLYSGTLHKNDQMLVIKRDGVRYNANIKQVFTFDKLGKVEVPEAHAGDIIAVVGVEDADIGDMVTSIDHPIELDPIKIDEPTMAVVFQPSDSPLVGADGDIVGARQLNERLEAEAESNVTMRIQPLEDKSGIEVAGRGILQISVLIETMRREGFELQVGRPRVLIKTDENGHKLEPIEEATVETPSEYAGKCIEVFGNAGGEMLDMASKGDQTQLVFRIPTRGTMGLRTKLLNATRGEANMFHRFMEYGAYRGEYAGRKNGGMISMSTEKAVAYALDTLQQRGTLFVSPGDDCYEGMIVGESAKEGDMVVNIAKTKNLGNQRSSSADKAIQLTPPVRFTLEEALEYIQDDELVEVTPKNIRLRKRILDTTARKKANKNK